MSNENMSHDEEYQYPQDEYVVDSEEQVVTEGDEEQEVAGQKPDSPLKEFLIKNKRKVAVAGVGILLLIIFQIMTHSKNQKVLKPAPVKPEVGKKVVTANKPQATSSYQTSAQPDPQLIRSLQTIQNSGVNNAEEIRELKHELQLLQNQLSDANRTNQQLKQAMVLLLQEVKQVNTTLKKSPKMATAESEKPKIHYNATAMINGRAWISGSKGASRSVTIGDTIPGFGDVTDIDAARGVVFTSSGKTITYGDNDY